MSRHKKPKPPIDWEKGKRWATTVSHWLELIVAVITLTLYLAGKA
ncbi:MULTISPECIES: hypothetical protein [Streptomyces]|uniref:SCO1431 family membrane protein n=1 Tax=Streptomyces luteosporeus TaxID=173856 RepID=A0ABN3TQP5_9ACTN